MIYIKTDWGIPLFFLVPLALMADPRAADAAHRAVEPDRELAGDLRSSCWRRRPGSSRYELSEKRTAGATYRARSELARELTQVWHTRFHSRWPVVAALYRYRPARSRSTAPIIRRR